MKFFIFVAFIAFVATVNADYPKEKNEQHNKIIAECRTKFIMTDEEYTKLRYDELPAPDENQQCLVNCFMETAGLLKDGKLQPDAATAMLNKKVGEEMAKKILEACGSESGSKKCETAYKLHKCFIKNKAY